MSVTVSRACLNLTQAEATAVLAGLRTVDPATLAETLPTGKEGNDFERACLKIRVALDAAERRDAVRADP